MELSKGCSHTYSKYISHTFSTHEVSKRLTAHFLICVMCICVTIVYKCWVCTDRQVPPVVSSEDWIETGKMTDRQGLRLSFLFTFFLFFFFFCGLKFLNKNIFLCDLCYFFKVYFICNYMSVCAYMGIFMSVH